MVAIQLDDDGPAYAVMELLTGETLGAALEHGPLPPRKAVEIAGQVARGLGSAHDGGVVHRDIKPDNLFLTPDGRVKILDFGLAALTGADDLDACANSATRTSLTTPGTVMGTINYMSSTRRPLAGFDPVWATESFEVSLDGSVVILSNLRPGGTVMLAENVPDVTPPRVP